MENHVMRIEMDIKLGFKEVLIRPKRSTLRTRSDVALDRTFNMLHSGKEWTGVPIIAANMDTVGTFEMADVLARHNMITAIQKYYSLQEWNDYLSGKDNSIFERIMVSTGLSESDLERLDQIMSAHHELKFICVDVANGYSEAFVESVRKIRESYPDKTIAAGNVVTGEMVEELLLSGADIVKVGIGSGAVCTTRVKAGVGYPQLSAVIECADAAHGLGGRIISDGGCVSAGDVAKAFGAGADFVMLGSMFAGHDEGGGEIFEKEGQHYKLFYGMSSDTAMDKYAGGVAEYRASEGKTVEVPYRGPVQDTIQDILGGVRSACTYVGASALRELTKRTTFIRVLEQESQVYSES
jgi:GMP reductase